YELPWFTHSSNGFVRNALGGWQWNALWSYQTGAHFEAWCRSNSSAKVRTVNGVSQVTNSGCEFNLDAVRDDRPDAAAQSVDATHDMWANGWGDSFGLSGTSTVQGTPLQGFGANTFFTRPCLGCVGNEGRNNLVGPNFFGVDMSLLKNFHVTERFNVQLRFESFNLFNRTNFELPGANSATNNRPELGNFGLAGGAFDPRQLQFGLKFSF